MRKGGLLKTKRVPDRPGLRLVEFEGKPTGWSILAAHNGYVTSAPDGKTKRHSTSEKAAAHVLACLLDQAREVLE